MVACCCLDATVFVALWRTDRELDEDRSAEDKLLRTCAEDLS